MYQDDEPIFKAKDVGNLLGIKNIRETVKNFDDSEKIKLKTQTNYGLQLTSYITERGLRRLLCSSRKPNSITLSKHLGIELSHKTIQLETAFVATIKKIFLGVDIREQYYLDGYMVDLYMPKYNLCIEYDEDKHKLNLSKDYKRQSYIEKTYKCTFLRIKEDEDILVFINKILHHIQAI
jgi:very-short-patch-repair endonuclease